MTPAQSKTLVAFWSHVRQIESRVRDNGHRPCPWDVDSLWDQELEESSEALHPLLVCLSKRQVFMAASSLPEKRGPIEADNAHQALMFQLNPEEAMYGNPSLLSQKRCTECCTPL